MKLISSAKANQQFLMVFGFNIPLFQRDFCQGVTRITIEEPENRMKNSRPKFCGFYA